MAVLELPIRSDISAYNFQIELEAIVFDFQFHFNARMDIWVMDIRGQDQTPIITGIPVQTDVDLIGRYVMPERPKGRLMAYDESGSSQDTTQYTFGSPIVLLYEERDAA